MNLLKTGDVEAAGYFPGLVRIDTPPAGQHVYRVQAKQDNPPGAYQKFNGSGRISTLLVLVLSTR